MNCGRPRDFPVRWWATLLADLDWSPTGRVACCALPARADDTDADGLRLFREEIEPVLKRECFGCHSAEAEEVHGGLRLDSRQAARRGGDSGPAVVRGKPAESLLLSTSRTP